MSTATVIRAKKFCAAAFACAAVSLMTPAASGATGTSDAPDTSGNSGLDGPGSYAVFRTLDSGNPATAEQNRRCDEYFGQVRSSTTIARLDARLFAFRSDPETGRLVDQTASYLGPGFICLAPAANEEGLEAYAYTGLQDLGESTGTGPCALAPVLASPGAAFVNCKLAIHPDPAIGLLGGMATSNSMANPTSETELGAPTGSVWTAYLVRKPGVVPYDPPSVPVPPVPPMEGLDFYVFRAFDTTTSTDGAECRLSGARASSMSAVQPDPRNGLLNPREKPTRDAGATLCLHDSGTATALVTLTRGGRQVEIVAAGDCQDFPTPAGPDIRQQACKLSIQSSTAPGARGGLITTIGLVPAGAPLETANSHIWTISLFADPEEAADEPREESRDEPTEADDGEVERITTPLPSTGPAFPAGLAALVLAVVAARGLRSRMDVL